MRVHRRLALPALLLVLGLIWAATHAFVHSLVSHEQAAGGAHEGHAATQGSAVQAYASYLPTSFALCLGLGIALAALLTLGAPKGWVTARSLWFFGLVPVIGFGPHALLAEASTTAAFAEFAPAFALGLLLQVPFALVALGIGRTILLVAERLAWSLLRPPALLAGAVLSSFDAVPIPAAPTVFVTGSARPRAPPTSLVS